MSDREQSAESNDAEQLIDELERGFEETGDELDALLDEIGSDSEPLAEESEAPQEPVVDDDDFGDLVSLPEVDDELDLSTGGEEENPVVDGSEEALTEPEQVEAFQAEPEQVEEFQAEPEQPEAESTEESMNSDPLAEVAAIAAERNAEAAKKHSGGRMAQLALAGVAMLALVAAVFAAWQVNSSASRIDELTAMVEALQQRKPVAATSLPADDGALRAELEKMMAQVNEMAATLDGSLVELREKNETALAAVQKRLDQLEKAPTPATSLAKPVMEKAPKTVPAKSAGGGWSVNLISLSNVKDADEELMRLRNLGIRAEKQRVEQDGRVWFRLRVPGFTSRDGARAYIATVENKAGVKNAWVGRN